MPVHVAAQAWPGTREAALEAECKARIAAIGRARGAKVIDWRIASPITTMRMKTIGTGCTIDCRSRGA